MFDIEFVANEPELLNDGDDTWLALRGVVTLGNFREQFLAAVGPWRRRDYERQWIEAAGRLIRGLNRTGFFTSAFRFWWVMWREGDAILVQEHLVIQETLIQKLDSSDPYRQIGERSTVSEDGQAISEWQLELADIHEFVERRKSQYATPYR